MKAQDRINALELDLAAARAENEAYQRAEALKGAAPDLLEALADMIRAAEATDNCASMGLEPVPFRGSALFAKARDKRIDAIVSLDGSFRYSPATVEQAGDVHPDQMKIPLLSFSRSEEKLVRYSPR